MSRLSSLGSVIFHQDFSILKFEIPANKNLFSIAFMLLWLGGWTVGEFFAYTSLIDGDTPLAVKAFLLVWLIGWTAGGGFVVYSILWQLFGKETFILERGKVTLEKSIFGLGKEHYYDLHKMKDISLSHPNKEGLALKINQTNKMGFKKGLLKFEYNNKVVKFACDITNKEAQALLEKLKSSGKFSRLNFKEEE